MKIKIMNCENCGVKIEKSDLKCGNCGQRISLGEKDRQKAESIKPYYILQKNDIIKLVILFILGLIIPILGLILFFVYRKKNNTIAIAFLVEGIICIVLAIFIELLTTFVIAV